MTDDRMVHPNAPVHFEHLCYHPGCTKWGSFGKERNRDVTEWRCSEHLATAYWEGRARLPGTSSR
jgi:hypothetical protein